MNPNAQQDVPSILDRNRKALEDAFFVEQDRKLIENLRKMKEMKETQEALARVSGIDDRAVLQKLIELNVRPETLASLAIVPLVEIAWADGEVHEPERKAVLAAIEKSGMAKGDIDYQLVEQWLTHRPPAHLLEAWTHYVQGLCSAMGAAEREALKTELIGEARTVAEAYGGLMGLGLGNRISKKEAAILAQMESAFARR